MIIVAFKACGVILSLAGGTPSIAGRAGRFGWEELLCWLKGCRDLGYALGDQKIISSAR